MQSELQQIEVEPVGRDDHDFTIDDRTGGELLDQRVVQFGKIAVEWTKVPALNVDVGLAAEDDGAEAVPFRFVQKAAAGRQSVGELREHWLDRRLDRKHKRR